MKKSVLLLSISLLLVTNIAAANITISNAFKLIRDEIPHGSNVYSGSAFKNLTWNYVFFVDEEPTKGWEHNCSYYFIPAQSPLTYTKESYRYPHYTLLNLQPYHIHAASDTCNVEVRNAVLTQDQLNEAGNTYAVILSGGISRYSNHARYWNDCSFVYKTLRNRFHIDKSHIIPLISDGADSGADMMVSSGSFVSSPLDLDGDGENDYQLAATKTNLQNVLTSLSQTMSTEDRLFLYVIDHGGTDDYISTSYICLWNYQRIYDYELADLLDQFDIASMNIVLGQCYSGGFIDDLTAPGRIISTACTGSESSYARSDLKHDEFVYHWTSAINERGPNGVQVMSDSNDDGWVTMREAFVYADSLDAKLEHPQFESNTIGESWAFNTSPFTYILMLRDNEEDIGEEPNTSTSITWASPDVWLRNQDDGLVNQTHQRINVTGDEDQRFHAYYRITNIGEKDYPGTGMFYHSYWADASIGLTSDVWLGQNTNGSNINGGVMVPVGRISCEIPAGDTAIVHKAYYIPDDIREGLAVDSVSNYHICFLTYLSDSQAQILNLPAHPQASNYVYVLGKRSIAQINAYFIENVTQAGIEFPLNINNPAEEERDFSIEVLPVDKFPADVSKIEVSMRMSPTLYATWERNNGSSAGVKTYASSPDIFIAKELNSKITNLVLAKNQQDKLFCSCRIIASEDVDEERTYAYDIALRDSRTGTLLDGERFVIRQNPRKAIRPEIKTIVTERGYLLEAANVDEAARYTWYDEDGFIVAEGKSVEVLPKAAERQYRLMVSAESDGCIAYASVMLQPMFSMKSVSPNPFQNKLTITLSAPATKGTAVKIAPLAGTGKVEEYLFKEGESELTVCTSDYVKGAHVVSLTVGNATVDTRQVVRN